MTKTQIMEFSRRVSQSSRTGLVVVTYDIILTYMETAEQVYDRGDSDSFLFNMKKAKQFLTDLSTNLNYDYTISYDLQKLYIFINNSFFQSIIRREPVNFECVREMLNKLRNSFDIISKEDKSGSVMKNTEKVYAGFTYGKGVLNEVVTR